MFKHITNVNTILAGEDVFGIFYYYTASATIPNGDTVLIKSRIHQDIIDAQKDIVTLLIELDDSLTPAPAPEDDETEPETPAK